MNKLVEEAPYHPGYEDAVIGKEAHQEDFVKHYDEDAELYKAKERHLNTAAKIIEFIKGGQNWQR